MQHANGSALDELERLLGRLADAIAQGDADALPVLVQQLQQRLGLLASGARGRPLPPAWRPRLHALIQRAQVSQSMLARRQAGVDRSLKSLAASLPQLQELQAGRTYGASGLLAAAGWRSQGFERA